MEVRSLKKQLSSILEMKEGVVRGIDERFISLITVEKLEDGFVCEYEYEDETEYVRRRKKVAGKAEAMAFFGDYAFGELVFLKGVKQL